MSLEAWGDEGAGISPRDWDRVIDRAIEMAAEDTELAFPEGVNPSLIVLEEVPADDYGWAFLAHYGGRTVEVFVSGSLLDPDDEP